MISKLPVSVYLEVYNEESRIDACLACFSWAEQIIVFDKGSTDNTVLIARKYTNEIYITDYNIGSNNVENFFDLIRCEWTLSITASSLIHPMLVEKISLAIKSKDAEVIGLPYGMYAFGINNKHSPWYTDFKFSLIKKSVLKLSSELHREIQFSTNRVIKLRIDKSDELFFHLTHQSMDSFFDRTLRYAKYEAHWRFLNEKNLSRNKALWGSVKRIIKSILITLIKKRTWTLGWNGAMLAFAYVLNFVCCFLYLWESYSKNQSEIVYQQLRENVLKMWSQSYISKDKNGV